MRATLAAVALTALLALTGCGGDPRTGGTGTTGDPTGTGSPPPAGTTGSPAPDATGTTDAPSTSEDRGVEVEMQLEGDRLTPIGQEVRLGVGEPLLIEVKSDRAGELHVHSTPERELTYGPGRSTLEVSFDRPGSVDIEDHAAGTLVFRVRVS